jgi:hypothetical protein
VTQRWPVSGQTAGTGVIPYKKIHIGAGTQFVGYDSGGNESDSGVFENLDMGISYHPHEENIANGAEIILGHEDTLEGLLTVYNINSSLFGMFYIRPGSNPFGWPSLGTGYEITDTRTDKLAVYRDAATGNILLKNNFTTLTRSVRVSRTAR